MTRRSVGRAVLVALMLTGGGCAPAGFTSGVVWTIQRSGVANAAFQVVRGQPSLRPNAFLLDRLDQVSTISDVTQARAEMDRILGQAAGLAWYAFNNEIDRLSAPALADIWHRYYSDEPVPHDLREEIRKRFWACVKERHAALNHKVESATSAEAVNNLARALRSATGPSPKDHRGGGPVLAMVAASFKDEQGSQAGGPVLAVVAASAKEQRGPIDGGTLSVDVYGPAGALTCAEPWRSAAGADEDQLLAAYAPIIVQEKNDDSQYDADTDRIGTVRLSGRSSGYRVVVGTKRPSVYAYWQYTWINGRKHLQLTYTHWFPRHPSLKRFDAEAGDIEGVTLRITLDSDDQPAVFETVLNCGCYHRGYPARRIETKSCKEYRGQLVDKRFCVERAISGKIDWIIPQSVDVVGGDLGRPILFSRAGNHLPTGISFRSKELRKRDVRERLAYTLRCYDDLERLPLGDGYASMFGPDGLVRGAGRLEGAFLALTGMLSAGQPRQRGTQLLHWDQYDFDDPHLLEKYLRLPSGF